MTKKRDTIKNYYRESYLFNRRVIVLVVIILLASSALISRLFFLQVTEHNTYKTLSNQNQLSLIPVEPNRGLIMDRNGVLLAENVPIFGLVITPERVKDMNDLIKQLKEIIDITPEDMKRFKKELRQHRPFQPITLKLKLNEQEVASFYVNQYKFPGATINAGMYRYYPKGKEFVSVLGYVARINEQEIKEIDSTNYAASSSIGKLGVEKYYEKELHGKVGYQQVEVDANGRSVRILNSINPVSGDNIWLTIDSRLQIAAEKILGQEKGAIVVVKPSTSEVLALVSYPGYDPNPFVLGIDPATFKELRNSPDKPLYNRAIRGVYPFASTIKPFLAIAGLDSGVITPSYSIRDPGYFGIAGVHHVYRDWRKEGHGIVNVVKAVTVSCDVFFYGLSVKLGIKRMAYYLRQFGFGDATGIDIHEELPGLVPSPEWKLNKLRSKWFLGDTISAGIGQGYMLTTPLQLAQGVAILANRGIRYRLHLLLKIENPDGTIEELKPEPLPPITLKEPKYWDLIIKAMSDVTRPGGTAAQTFSGVPYTIAAKTGTAQLTRIVGENTHGSDALLPKNLRNHKLFIAFAPIDQPQIAVAVLVENSDLAPKVARRVFDYYFGLTHQYGMIDTIPAAADGSDGVETANDSEPRND